MMFMLFVSAWMLTFFHVPEGRITTTDQPCSCKQRRADCSYRNLSYVPGYLPTNIQQLNMEGNVLEFIGPGAFERYRSLTILNLAGNKLNLSSTVYDSDAFSGLDQLQVLRLDSNYDYLMNHLENISYPDNALSNLTSLEELCIDGIPNVVFGTGFSNLKKLQNITFLGFCYLDRLHKNMFNNTRHLRFLNISNCHIYHIDKEAFLPLREIDTIDLSKNYGLGMRNVTTATYGLQNSSVRVLYANSVVLPFSLHSRYLKNDTLKYLYNTNITEIYLDHNLIELLEPGSFDKYPPFLKLISANDNGFRMGQYIYDLMKLKSLETLYVNDRTIVHHFLHSSRLSQSTDEDIGDVTWQGPPNLQHITAKNYLMDSKIPPMNINMSSIKSVDFSNNVLVEWIGPVKYFESLQSANLSRCFCSKIDQNFFSSFPNLENLNISYNLIGDALRDDTEGATFRNLTSLKKLDLSTNRIRFFHPQVFKSNLKLKYLNLSNNEITNISFEVTQLEHLVELDLHRNELRSLHQSVRAALDTIPHKVKLDLSDNPLQCTCENIKFLIWLSKTKVQQKNFKSYTCFDYYNTKIQLNMRVISVLQTKCQSVFGILISGIVAIVFFLTVLVISIVYRHRWKLKYLYYVAKDHYRPQIQHGKEQRYYEFDAFVSCADEDLEFVDTLLHHLEGQGKRLCVHHRDFRPGEPIASNIVRAVQRSRRTLLILSRHFLSSAWCKYEFEMAKMEAVHDGRNVILVVKIGEIKAAQIPREMMYLMKTDSYAEFPQRIEDQAAFWVTLNSAI